MDGHFRSDPTASHTLVAGGIDSTELQQEIFRKDMKSNITVLKFGGSSLATVAKIRNVAAQIEQRRRRGQDVLVVASAMGPTTARLMSLAGEIDDSPSLRELDKLLSTGECVSTTLLCMELGRIGVDAISLTGAECGIRTNDQHFNAAVESIDTRRMLREFASGRVVVAAGFQGRGSNGEVTTLGLGGSDITAVVLAGALGARQCEICSDVDGVYSADPRIVKGARRIDEISYDEMVELSRHGASVLNSRAVEYARSHGVEIHARSTFEPDAPGTLIRDLTLDSPRVVGVAGHDSLVRVALDDTEDAARTAVEGILDELDEDAVFIDHRDPATNRRDILIPAERLSDAASFTSDLKSRFADDPRIGMEYGSVSAIGLGVGATGRVQGVLESCSRKVDVGPRHDFTSEHAITCVVGEQHASRLMNLFHREFDCPAEEEAA